MIDRRPHRQSTSTTRKRGFTLLEVLVASVVLVAGLVVVLGSISGGVAASNRTSCKAEAQVLAADMLNRAEAGAAAVGGAGDRMRGGVVYTWTLTSDVSNIVVCRVEWELNNHRRSVTLSRRFRSAGGAAP